MTASDPDWSPDARQIVFRCFDERYRLPESRQLNGICLVGGGRVLRLLVRDGVRYQGKGGYFVDSPRWSPVRDEIVFVRHEDASPDRDLLQMVRPDDPQPRPLTTVGRAYDPSWDPTGARLAYVRIERRTCRIELITRTGSVERQLLEETHPDSKGPPMCPYELAWAPNGRQIAYARGDAGIRIELIQADRQAPPQMLAGNLPHPLAGLAWRRRS